MINSILHFFYTIVQGIKNLVKQTMPQQTWFKIKNRSKWITEWINFENFYVKQWARARKTNTGQKKFQHYKDGFNIVGYLQSATGLGQSARALIRSLETTQIPFEPVDYTRGLTEDQLQSPQFANTKAPEFKYKLNILHINPPQMPILWEDFSEEQLTDHYTIGMWYWELPEFPDRWTDRFGLVDEVWTATEFVRQTIQAKSPVPVHVVPPAIKVEIDPSLSLADFGLPESRFYFFMAYDAGSVQTRKNPSGAIEAFFKAFEPDDETVGLIIKVNSVQENQHLVEALKNQVKEHQNIFFLEKTFTRTQFNSLLSLIDVVVSLHRSEGFGLIPAEAMYLGKPVIMTNWSGNVDFIREDNCCPVDFKLIEVGKKYLDFDSDQLWADPDIDQAAEYMRRLINDHAYYEGIAQKAKDIIHERYAPEAVGKMIERRYEAIKRQLSNY